MQGPTWLIVAAVLALPLVAAGAVVATGRAGPVPAAQAEPVVRLDPAEGPCGVPIAVAGERYPPGATVEVVGPSTGAAPLAGSRTARVTADGAGHFSLPVDPCPDAGATASPPQPGATLYFAAYTVPAGATMVSARAPFRLTAPPAAPALPSLNPAVAQSAVPAAAPPPLMSTPAAPAAAPPVAPVAAVAPAPLPPGERERLPSGGELPAYSRGHGFAGLAGALCLLFGLDLRRRAGPALTTVSPRPRRPRC